MLNGDDVLMVDALVGYRNDEDVNESWARIKTALVESQKSSTNKQSVQFICCLGSEHKCMMNVNDGYCADGTGDCQYKVRIN